MRIEKFEESASTHVLAGAVLVCKVTFLDSHGHQIVLKKGTEVLIDLMENIGNYEEHHFDISSEEYFVLPPATGLAASEAVSLKDISFTCAQGLPVTIPTGSRLTVDSIEFIAYFNGHHFDIHHDEFSLVR